MEVCSRTSITTVSHAFLSTAAPRSRRASCSGVNPFGVLGANASIIPIQVVACDVTRDGRRNLAGHGFAGRQQISDLTGRHVRSADKAVDDARGFKAGGRELGWPWILRARAGNDHDRSQLADSARLVPRAEQTRAVPAQDEEELVIRVCLAELAQRV